MSLQESSLRSCTFREGGVDDFQEIEKLFEREGVAPGWADWKYLRSPDGHARVFVAESPDETIVGTLVYMPRHFSIPDGGSLTVMQAVDIYLSANLRDQQVFLGLLGFARQHVSGAKIGMPNESSEIFASGKAWRVLGQYDRYLFPVAAGARFADTPMTLFVSLANGLSRIYQLCWLAGNRRGLSMQLIERFDKDFSFDPTCAHGIRSAAYLNWRFVDNPVGTYKAYEFFDGDESVGYCVFTQVAASLIVSDFVASRRHRHFMRILVEYCRNNEIAWIVYNGLGLRLRSLGFIRRGEGWSCVASGLPEAEWVVNLCDIDSEPGRTQVQTN
jgi:hypothetical protein